YGHFLLTDRSRCGYTNGEFYRKSARHETILCLIMSSEIASHQSNETNHLTAALTCGRDVVWMQRSALPSRMSTEDFNIWSFVKQCIGKDLTKISMPVALNEPISFLQRIAEYMEYSELLLKAVKHSDPIRRLEVSLSSIPIKLPAFVVPRRTVDFNRYTRDGGLKFHRSLQW
ncbi:Oxysterol-binding protein, partial [Fasciolopsis buskii]